MVLLNIWSSKLTSSHLVENLLIWWKLTHLFESLVIRSELLRRSDLNFCVGLICTFAGPIRTLVDPIWALVDPIWTLVDMIWNYGIKYEMNYDINYGVRYGINYGDQLWRLSMGWIMEFIMGLSNIYIYIYM